MKYKPTMTRSYSLKVQCSFFAILLCVVLTASCSFGEKDDHAATDKNKVETVEGDFSKLRPYKLSDVFAEVKYLRLSTPDSMLIGAVEKIRRQGDRLFVGTRRSLFVFSEKGDFLFIINKYGEGEGEYIGIDDFWVNENLDMEVLDRRNKKIMCFDKKGKLKNELKIGVVVRSFAKTGPDDYLFSASTHQAEEELLYALIGFSKKSGEITFKAFPINPERAESMNFMDYNNFAVNGADALFSVSGKDTIYTVGKDGVSARYYLDFGKNKVPGHLLNDHYADVTRFIDKLSKSSYGGIFNAFIYSDEDRMFTLPTIQAASNGVLKKAVLIYDRKTKDALFASAFVDDMNLLGHKQEFYFENLPRGHGAGELYFVAEPSELIETRDSLKQAVGVQEWSRMSVANKPFFNMISTLNITDNPLVVIYKFHK